MNIYNYLIHSITEDYQMLRCLKESARGQVQIVQHKESGRRYVFRRFDGNGEVYKKLLNISCPHLPQILEMGMQDGKTVVLEEYIQGDTLSFLLEGGLPSAAESKKIMRDLCSALWVLHSMGAVHRDIKPENIILRGRDAVLIDFDASRIYKIEQETDTKVLGTTGFAAPEQYGIYQSDARADIYSLGILLNIMLTGKHPSVELATGKMGRIVQKCTMTNPKKRYRNVLQLMETL